MSRVSSAQSDSLMPRLLFLDESYLGAYFDIVAPLRGEQPVTIQVPGGVARLVKRQWGRRWLLETPGRGFADYMDLEYSSTEAGEALLEILMCKSGLDLLVLHGVSESSPTVRLVQEKALKEGWLFYAQKINSAPYVEICDLWERFHLKRKDRKSRYNLRRAARRLSEIGKVEIIHYTDPGEVESHLNEAFYLYERRVRGIESRWRFSGEVGRSFYRAIALAFARRNAFDLAFLRVGGEPVAFVYGLRYDGVYYYYVVGMTDEPQIARLSPGSLLLEHLLERAFNGGFQWFDLMAGSERYKSSWSTGSRDLFTVVLGRRQVGSASMWLIYLAILRIRQWIRSSVQRRWALEKVAQVSSRFSTLVKKIME